MGLPVAPSDDLPSRRETLIAYGTSCLAALVWIACVIPGAVLADPTHSDDLATPMARAALLILPALLLLVTGPIALLIASRPEALRSLLASGDAFVTLFSVGILLHHRRGDVGRLVAAIGLAVLFVVSVRDAVRPSRAGPPDRDAPVAQGGLRLALALLGLLAPASLLIRGSGEPASSLAPYAYVAISALGSRISTGVLGLRMTAALLFMAVSAHLAISIRYGLGDGVPPIDRFTAAGVAAVCIAVASFAVAACWVVELWVRLRRTAS